MNRLSTPIKATSPLVMMIRSLMASALIGMALLENVSPRSAQAQSTAQNPPSQNTPSQNLEIKVGIVQRFGEEKDDKIAIAPLAGDQIRISFKTNGQAQSLTTNRVQIDIAMQPLSEPVLQEWVVLSSHRSFESAEDSATRWQAAGIKTEIAQPDAWQVWAKREDYGSPLLRRLLLENLHKAGYTGAFIDSKVLKEVPKAAFTVNGYRYVRDEFSLTTGNRRVQMAQGVTPGNNTRYGDLFAGDLKIQPNAYGTYTLVNQVPIESYLRGVVPHEIGAGAPRNAIEAQAILARTYALRNLRRFATDNYEICADTQCQVYFGLAETDAVSDQAIAATASQVLTYENELVDALYSSTTGGVTARFTDVWNGEDRPYLRPVIDSLQIRWNLEQKPLADEANFREFIALSSGFNEDGWPAFRWNQAASLKEIGDSLKEYLTNRQHPLANFTQISGLTITERSPSGRVQKIQVDTDLGSFDLLKDEVVKALIPPRSLLFYLEPIIEAPKAIAPPSAGKTGAQSNSLSNPASPAEPLDFNLTEGETEGETDSAAKQKTSETGNAADQTTDLTLENKQAAPQPVVIGYRFIGGGFGHGVGMSQAGAYNLGKQGYSSEQILEFYYPGTALQPISESITFWKSE